MVEKATKEVENIIREEGEQATLKLVSTVSIPNWLNSWDALNTAPATGRMSSNIPLRLPTLCGVMAAEIGADIQLASGQVSCTISVRL